MRPIAKSTLSSRREQGSGRVEGVPKILNTLYTYMQQSTHRPFLLRAVFLLARFHQEPVISSLLQKGLPMDSDTVELWRSLGKSIFGIQILRCLVEKLNRAGNNRLGTDSSACEQHNRHTALETLTITRAISEVVLALSSTEELRQLLPHLLPSLLRWASETLGEERLLSPMSSWRQLFLEGQVLEEKPCRCGNRLSWLVLLLFPHGETPAPRQEGLTQLVLQMAVILPPAYPCMHNSTALPQRTPAGSSDSRGH
ncbi:maestro heat-like repeat-containing protein family member 2B [Sarcoramphus papa]